MLLDRYIVRIYIDSNIIFTILIIKYCEHYSTYSSSSIVNITQHAHHRTSWALLDILTIEHCEHCSTCLPSNIVSIPSRLADSRGMAPRHPSWIASVHNNLQQRLIEEIHWLLPQLDSNASILIWVFSPYAFECF